MKKVYTGLKVKEWGTVQDLTKGGGYTKSFMAKGGTVRHANTTGGGGIPSKQ